MLTFPGLFFLTGDDVDKADVLGSSSSSEKCIIINKLKKRRAVE